MKFCIDCLMELKNDDDLEYHSDLRHKIREIDDDDKDVKAIQKYHRSLIRHLKKNGQEMIRTAYAKPPIPDELKEFFYE